MPVTHSPLKHRIDALEAEFGSAVRALYVEDKRGNPDPIGSGVLGQFGSRLFLLTAAHVLRECGDQPLWIAGDEEFAEIAPPWFRSVAPLGPRAVSDRFDVGFVELSDAIRVRLGFIRPVELHHIDLVDRRLPQTPYVGMGFPIKKTNIYKKERLVGASLVRVSAFSKPGVLEKLGLSAFTHVAVGFDRKRTFVDGILQPAIKPHGMSGGGLWRFDSLFGDAPNAGTARLVGILTEFHEYDIKAMIGTRIALFLEMIRHAFPDVDAFLPRSTLGDIVPIFHESDEHRPDDSLYNG